MEPEDTSKAPEESVPPVQPAQNAGQDDAAKQFAVRTAMRDLRDAGIDIVEEPGSYSADSSSDRAMSGDMKVYDNYMQAPQYPRPAAPRPSAPAARPAPAQASPMPPFRDPSAAAPAAPQYPQFGAPISMDMQGNIQEAPGAGPAKDNRNDPSIKPLRTFKTDAEEAVRYQNISAAQIALAEQRKKEAAVAAPVQYAEEEKKSSSSFVLILLAVLFVALLGGAGYYYWYFMKPSEAPRTVNVPKGLTVKTLIPYAKAELISLKAGGDTFADIAKKLAATDVHIGEVYALVPVPAGTTTVIAAPSAVLQGTRIPDRLLRSLGSEYMVGTYVYHANGPFIILKDTFFQNAFAGMLDWEKNLRNDFIPLIRVTHPDETIVDTDTDVFTDALVSNVDARALKNGAGDTILAYAFADKDTIVIAADIDTLKYVLEQLLTVRVVQ